MKYAGFWKRALALLIDSIVLVPVGCIFYIFDKNEDAILYSFLANQVIMWLYFSLFESQGWQGTPGKHFLGIKVTDLNGNRITFARATARYFSKFFSSIILGIGYLMAAFTKRKQALHDLIAETLVVSDKDDSPSAFTLIDSADQTQVLGSPHPDIGNQRQVIMAGFDSSGNVLRLSFLYNDPRLDTSGLVIGRDSTKCDLHIADQTISRQHARIFKKQGDIWIEDLGSTNGMTVNGREISSGDSALLTSSGSLAIGGIVLTLGGGRR